MIAVIEWDAWTFLGCVTILAIIWIAVEMWSADEHEDEWSSRKDKYKND